MTHDQHMRLAAAEMGVFRIAIVFAAVNLIGEWFAARLVWCVLAACFLIDVFLAFPVMKRNWYACDRCSKLIPKR